MDQQLNMRVSEEVAGKFKDFCKEQGISQPQGLDSLLSMMELVQAKEKMPSRETEIDNFRMHTQALLDSFLHSLALNADAEERVRGEFASALASKDKIIKDLQERQGALQLELVTAREDAHCFEELEQQAKKELKLAREEQALAMQRADDKEQLVTMQQDKIATLTEKLADYERMKAELEQVGRLQDELRALKIDLREKEYESKEALAEVRKVAYQEREHLEQEHRKEIKELYEKMSAYQDTIAELMKQSQQPKSKSTRTKANQE